MCRYLIEKMLEWREEGDKLILMLDGNENMETVRLERMLRNPDFDMQDVVKLCSNTEGPATFVRGSRKIDGAWVTPGIEISTAYFLPFYFGVGDHIGILFDIPHRSLIGGAVHKITKPTARRLQFTMNEVQKSTKTIWNYIVLNTKCKKRCTHYSLLPNQ